MNASSDLSLVFADVPTLSGSIVKNTPKFIHAIAVAMLAFALPEATHAQISQINILHTVPGTVKQATGNDLAIIPGGIGFDHFNGTEVERRIYQTWGTNADFTPSWANWTLSTDGGRTYGATEGFDIIAAADGHVNRSITSRNGSYSIETNARPSATTMNATISLCQGAQTADTGLACTVRFNSSGNIDARNGSAYAADVTLPYTANGIYLIRFEVNVTARTYTIRVRPPGAGQSFIVLGSNYAFRTEQSGVTALDTFNYRVNSGASDTLKVSTTNLGGRVVIKKRNGEILCLKFASIGPPPTSSSLNFPYFRSTDGASTWTDHTALVDFGSHTCSSFFFHRGAIEENDGSLYAIGYGTFTGEDTGGNHRVAMVRSTNGGTSWTLHQTIAAESGRNFSESTLVRCANGTWLVVMLATGDGGDRYLRYRRSTDQGATWNADGSDPDGSIARRLPGMTSVEGVDPVLNLMPNGILVLSWGPHNAHTNGSRDYHIAFSTDGNGTNWSSQTVVLESTFWNSSDPYTITAEMCETSGYSAIHSVGAHRFIHLSDTGHSWSYPSPGASPNPYSIQGKYVDVVRTNEINRIDLKGRLAAGTVTITTDMTYTDSNNQESRFSAAFDGSTDYWSGAFKNATSGSYTIDLQSDHTLNKIGVCLQYNTPESATIAYSTNGTSWTTIKTYTNATHRALDYTALAFTARYIRVSATSSAAPVCLNEIELYYGYRDTFENNAVGIPGSPHGIIPPGWVAGGTSATQYGFAVRDNGAAKGYNSERSFQMWDGSSTWRAGIKKTQTASASRILEFRVKPLAYSASGGAIQFVLGSSGSAVYQMAIFPDGSIKYYNGSAWVSTTGTGSPAGAGTVPLDAWSLIRVTATISPATAAITVNGVAQGNAGKIGSATSMDYISFASGGTGPHSDNALFDDVFVWQ